MCLICSDMQHAKTRLNNISKSQESVEIVQTNQIFLQKNVCLPFIWNHFSMKKLKKIENLICSITTQYVLGITKQNQLNENFLATQNKFQIP